MPAPALTAAAASPRQLPHLPHLPQLRGRANRPCLPPYRAHRPRARLHLPPRSGSLARNGPGNGVHTPGTGLAAGTGAGQGARQGAGAGRRADASQGTGPRALHQECGAACACPTDLT